MLEEIAEEVEDGGMPQPKYLWLHPQSALTEGQKDLLAAWAGEDSGDRD